MSALHCAAIELVSAVYEIKADTRDAWTRAFERLLRVNIEHSSLGAKVIVPSEIPRRRGWVGDELARESALDEPLSEVVSIDHRGAQLLEAKTMSLQGQRLDPESDAFRRIAAPVLGLREPATLVIQIEHDDEGPGNDRMQCLDIAAPYCARAYAHCVGWLEDHRTHLLDRLSPPSANARIC
ncbi:MAG: hypothetical protein Tsb0013_24180 [Phycisphaerales bacterium]